MIALLQAFFPLLLSLQAESLPVEFFKADEVEHVLPKSPADYPDALQGLIWMDQVGFYAYSNVPAGLPDGAMSFGDPAHTLDHEKEQIIVNSEGPAWQWMNNKEAYAAIASSKGLLNYKYQFQFKNNYTSCAIYILVFGHGIWVPSPIVSFTMELQTPPPGACPPPPGASKTDIAKCAKWHRISHGPLGVGTFHYYAFEIVDKNGERVEPYYSKYLEWANKQNNPSEKAASMFGLTWTGKLASQNGTTLRGAPPSLDLVSRAPIRDHQFWFVSALLLVITNSGLFLAH